LHFDYTLFFLACGVLAYETWFWLCRLKDVAQSGVNSPDVPADRHVNLPKNPPLISVIVPAHNEESGIRECLESVLKQDYPNFELILVDDRSQDATLTISTEIIAGRPNARIINVDSLRSGWTGKCNALDIGVKQAKGEWLAFLDADSTLHPGALRQCYFEAVSRNINMITLSPRFVLKSFWEKALQPTFASMSCILFPVGKVNDPQSPVASANGMFYLISKSGYEAIGGHLEVRNLAVEDIGIGKRVKAAGLGLLFANGRNLLQTRMYSSFREIIDGWTRILSASMNYDLGAAVKYLFMHVLMSFPVSVVALCLFVPVSQQIWPWAWFVFPAGYLTLTALVSTWYCAKLGVPKSCPLLMVFGNLFLIWVFLVIPKKILRKDALQWRGTTYKGNLYEPTALEPTYPGPHSLSRETLSGLPLARD
jgi:chlorobactene glucosyltransferase